MNALPNMNRCATCGQEWRGSHVCQKQPLKNGMTLEEWVTATKIVNDNMRAGDGWPKLTKPARVGNCTFGVGISSRLVVEAAQRQHEYHQTGALEEARKHSDGLATALEFVRQSRAKTQALIDAGKCPDCEGEGVLGGQFTGGEQTCETCNGSGKP